MNFTDRTWKTERKWTGNHKLFTDAGMVADYYYPLVKSAQNTNKRWLEWFIVENYKYSKKSWDAVQPYIPIYEKEIKENKKRSREFLLGETIARKGSLGYDIGLAGLTVLNEWLGNKTDTNLKTFIHLTEKLEPYKRNTDRSAYCKQMTTYTSEFKKKISDTVINHAINGSRSDRDTVITINGLTALSERLPFFDYVSSTSKYKKLTIFDIFLNIFNTEPFVNMIEYDNH